MLSVDGRDIMASPDTTRLRLLADPASSTAATILSPTVSRDVLASDLRMGFIQQLKTR
jgi:hypothetical protein